jgi:ArsR family transcriptional regulator, arsenate/arsenite/antimonite-responsive transcriptional repressor
VIELAAHRRDRLLVDAGILTREQRGKWAYYRLAPEVLNALAALITTPTV